MSEITQEEAEARATPWQLVKLRLRAHETYILANGDRGAGAFLSRGRLYEAIVAWAKSEAE